jgi:hypothetical protein
MLFNKNGNGTTELRKHAGFLYASVDFQNIEPDILLSSEYIEEIVGANVMELAQGHYDSTNYLLDDTDDHKLLDKLVSHIQLPVSLFAIREFQMLTDVAHQETGRKMKMAENEKLPFEWLLERDDKAILTRAHKTTDRLIAFLDKNIDDETAGIGEAWADSEAYQQSKKLFINTSKAFDAIFPINQSRMFFIKVLPFIEESERELILSTIGATRFDALKEKIIDQESLDAADKLLLSFIYPPLVLNTMKIAIQRLPLEIIPQGIFSNVELKSAKTSDSTSSINLRNRYIAHFKEEVKQKMMILEKHIITLEPIVDEDETSSTDYSTESFFRL